MPLSVTPESPEAAEFALLRLSEEEWTQVIQPSIIRRDDETYQTGDSFFDSLEDALASGEDINELLSKLAAATQ